MAKVTYTDVEVDLWINDVADAADIETLRRNLTDWIEVGLSSSYITGMDVELGEIRIPRHVQVEEQAS